MSVQLLVGIVALAGGLVLIGHAAKYARESLRIRRGALRVPGTVVGHVRAPGDSDGPETFFLEVAFDYRGRHVCRSRSSTSHPRRIGRAVTVLIPGNRPSDARVHTFAEWWFLPLLLAWLGFAFSAAAAVLIARAP